MPAPFYVDDFADKIDSLYRLVIVGARRSNMISNSQSHGFGGVTYAKKPTIQALEEMLDGKISYRKGDDDDEVVED
jgi:DNA-directed RNA polymerase omega subunit